MRTRLGLRIGDLTHYRGAQVAVPSAVPANSRTQSGQQFARDLQTARSWYKIGSILGGLYLPDWAYQAQDSAGTAVTAAGQTVGMWKDATWGGDLGPELVTNGTFDADASWIKGAGWTIADGVASKTGATTSSLSQNCHLKKGKTYFVTASVTKLNSGTTISFSLGGYDGVATGGSGSVAFYVTIQNASSNENLYLIDSGTAWNGTVDTVSVREVLGNHAIQTTTANKPLSARTSTTLKNYLSADSTDVLPVTFPSALGSSCTIARATPAGVTFSESQTIDATWNGIVSPYQYNSAVLVANRALTAQEKAVVSRVLGRYVPSLGADAEANPGMDADASWAKGTGWGIGSGVATKSAGTASNLSQDVATSGKLYFVSADIVRTAGTIGAADGTNQRGAFAETGGLRQTIVSSSATIGLRGDASFAGTADNVRILEVL